MLCGCKGRVLESEQLMVLAQRQAHSAGMTWSLREAGVFTIATAIRRTNLSDRIHVYIEGDGRAWTTRSRLSTDPTPRRATALALAVKDTHPSVAYIARPCQYLGPAALADCAPQYWSSHRYSQAVIKAISEVLDELAKPIGGEPAPRFTVVGYSGGGTLAALLSAMRDDVDGLITVAANLDHHRWTTFHGVSPLHSSASLDTILERLAKVHQCHLFGQNDTIVPPHLAQPLLSRLVDVAGPASVSWSTVKNFDHDCCWTEIWPHALKACMSD
jgi:hypothetical protein